MVTFLLEVGVEELPAQFVDDALAQWWEQLPQTFAEAGITPNRIQVYGTPRRLAIVIKGLPPCQPDRVEEVKGPPAQAAFKDGQPTPAAQGFARKQGVDVSDLQVRPTDKGDFVFVEKQIPGQATPRLLQDWIPQWINQLEGKRFMRWGDGDLRFSRPIRWLVALWGDEVLPITLDNGSSRVESSRISQGHRVLHPDPVCINRAEEYGETLKAAFVLVDPKARRERIREQLETVAAAAGGIPQIPEDLLAEVTQLVEWPTAVLGDFEESFLQLPPEVITTVMITHQRYFPLYKPGARSDSTCTQAQDSLLPHFITISNGDPAKAPAIALGNGRVIRARLADGEFFYKADRKQPLEAYGPQLETVTFQASLGSMAAKVERIVHWAKTIAQNLHCDATQTQLIERSAQLCKADLVTQMVFEFPELQGIMGQKYALLGGEDPQVAQAILEHYWPQGAGAALPTTLTAQVVALADRLDTLVCIFGLGMIPSGSSDPFALRRAATGVINIIWAGHLPLNLAAMLNALGTDFSQRFPTMKIDPGQLQTQLGDFFLQRIRTLLEEQGLDYDLVNAILGDGPDYQQRALANLLDLQRRSQVLQGLRQSGQLEGLYETINRSTRLASQGTLDTQTLDPQGVVEVSLFEQSSEQALYEGLVELLPDTQLAQAQGDYDRLIAGLTTLAPKVSRFFDGDDSVMVMAEDPAVKTNRLNLLGLVRNHSQVLADFGAIVKGAS